MSAFATLDAPHGAQQAALPVTAGRTHLPALDGLRGVAILLVVVHHAINAYPLTSYQGWWSFFYNLKASMGYGVVLFFVLSGFLITGILLDSKESPRYFRDFFGRRVVRIFPLYYGTIAAVWLAAHRHGFPEAERFAARLPWLLTYTTNLLIADRGTWEFSFGWLSLNHFWSLAVEEQFYLLWPLIVLRSSTRLLRRICLVAVPLAFAARAFLFYGASNLLAANVSVLSQVDALALGAWLAITVREHEGWVARNAWYLVGIGAGVSVAACVDGAIVVTAGRSGVAVLSAGLIGVGLYHRPAAWFSHPVLRTYGKYSYGIYVLHVFLLPFFVFLHPLLGSVGFALYICVLSLVAGWLSWHLYEMHFLRLKRFFPAGAQRGWTPRQEPACTDAPVVKLGGAVAGV